MSVVSYLGGKLAVCVENMVCRAGGLTVNGRARWRGGEENSVGGGCDVVFVAGCRRGGGVVNRCVVAWISVVAFCGGGGGGRSAAPHIGRVGAFNCIIKRGLGRIP